MLYNMMEIRPVGRGSKRKWEVTITKLPHERHNEHTVPHPLGFYCYPRRKSVKAAFNELVGKMIRDHEEELERIQDSLVKLRKLTPPT